MRPPRSSESDVYLLILGGRYGSIEPVSGKSYTHLEYDYALSRKIPSFAVVARDAYLKERVQQRGLSVWETEHPQKLKEFRMLVESKVVRHWEDTRDIKIAILEKLNELSRREDLRGWIPGDRQVDAGAIAEQLAALTRENTELRERVAALSDPRDRLTFSGLTFGEVTSLLRTTRVPIEKVPASINDAMATLGGDVPELIHVLWSEHAPLLSSTVEVRARTPPFTAFEELVRLGLVETRMSGSESSYFRATSDGRTYLLRLEVAVRAGREEAEW